MDLTNKKISDTYPNVLTIGDLSNTTSGALTNGAGQPITDIVHSGNLTVDKIKYNGFVTQTLAGNGIDISTTTILDSGLSVIDTATPNDNAVRLPQPVFGKVVNIVNTSGVDILVFPYDDQSFHFGQAAGEPFVVPSDGLMYTFTCIQNPNVGVWTVITPSSFGNNMARVTVEQDITFTTDSSATGVNQLTEGLVGATNIVISNVPYVCAVAVPNSSDALILWDSIFNNYNEISPVKYEVLSNIPVGDLNDLNGQTPAAAMGISNADALSTVGCNLAAATKNFSVSCGAFAGTIRQAQFSGLYNVAYILNGGGVDVFPNVALPGDPGVAGNVYQKAVFNINAPFEPLFDANSNPAKYFMLSAYLGNNTYPQHSAFPNGTVIQLKVKATFDLKK